MVELIIEYGILIVLGAMFGSYAAATVWRLRSKQLAYDKKHGEKVSKEHISEVARLKKNSIASDRSVCLHCGRQLAWYELIPVFSWLALRGKCRTCKKPIGRMELFAELGVATAFALSYTLWPHALDTGAEQGMFAVWLAVIVVLAIQWMYDVRWQLLLTRITVLLGVFAVAFAALYMNAFDVSIQEYLVQAGILLLILPVFYGVLYVVGKGAWVGLGDVYLLIPFAIMLASWEYGILLIFLANLIGLLVLLPGLATKKLNRRSRVPFGPFLIIGFMITMLLGGSIISYYVRGVMY